MSQLVLSPTKPLISHNNVINNSVTNKWYLLSPSEPTKQCLNPTAFLNIVCVYPFLTTVHPSSDGCLQLDNVPCHKAHLKRVS